ELVDKGRDHVRGGRWREAREAFEQALGRDGRSAAAYSGLGEVAFQEQKFADAAEQHRRSTLLAPRNADYQVNLGMAYFKLQNYAQAKKSWEKALELKPGEPKATRYLQLVEKKLSE
ncbi:MAG: tetratricopeptide repeat protein, partial [Myxococcales bacterium]|nr:tetratricopeptide repeat protein [Myxococcales bacterium]